MPCRLMRPYGRKTRHARCCGGADRRAAAWSDHAPTARSVRFGVKSDHHPGPQRPAPPHPPRRLRRGTPRPLPPRPLHGRGARLRRGGGAQPHLRHSPLGASQAHRWSHPHLDSCHLRPLQAPGHPPPPRPVPRKTLSIPRRAFPVALLPAASRRATGKALAPPHHPPPQHPGHDRLPHPRRPPRHLAPRPAPPAPRDPPGRARRLPPRWHNHRSDPLGPRVPLPRSRSPLPPPTPRGQRQARPLRSRLPLAPRASRGRNHRGSVAFYSDGGRDLELRSQGYAVLRFTDEQLEHQPERVAAAVARELAQDPVA